MSSFDCSASRFIYIPLIWQNGRLFFLIVNACQIKDLERFDMGAAQWGFKSLIWLAELVIGFADCFLNSSHLDEHRNQASKSLILSRELMQAALAACKP